MHFFHKFIVNIFYLGTVAAATLGALGSVAAIATGHLGGQLGFTFATGQLLGFN